ncbi:MAG: glycosyltransferase family 4 protein [bacterium]
MRFANALAWHCREVAAGLLEAGHEVFVLAQRDSPLASWLQRDGIPCDIRANLNRVTPKEVYLAGKVVRDTLRLFRPDVLNPHCPPGHFYLSLHRKRHAPEATLVRTVGEPRPPKRNFVNRRLHQTGADGIIVTCEASRQRYLRRFRLEPEKVQVIYPGFDGKAFANYTPSGKFRQRYGIPNHAKLVGVVARLSPEKGHRVLLEAFSRVHQDFPEARLLIVGADAREQTAKDLAEFARVLHSHQQVIFTGEVADVREVMAELDLAVIPSVRSEAICRVALEYMTWKIPIIATNVNILPEVVRDGVNGWVVPVGDAAALSRALGEALQNESERKKRGAQGRELVLSEFSRARMIERTLDFYRLSGARAR